MTLDQALRRARVSLTDRRIEDAPLECELLMRHTLGISRPRLYLEPERVLSPAQESAFWQNIRRRLGGEPSAYITGHREFYGLDFYVDRRVLIPRPESELLVETALGLSRSHPPATVADIGTGSGAVAISLALNLPGAEFWATDIAADALEVARRNCHRHGVSDRIHLLPGSLLEPLPQPVDLIVANLPYVRQADLGGLRCEPVLALDGGADGTEKIQQLCRQARDRVRPAGSMLLEVGQGQAEAVVSLLGTLFPGERTEVIPDLAGIDRVVSLNLT